VLLAAGCFAVALPTLLVPAAPDYDAWAWLAWGRELWDGTLSTAEGPAFKPLPVAVTALLAPLGAAAPEAWLVVARAGAVAAVVLAARVAWRLASDAGPRGAAAATVLAAAGVLLTGGFVRHAMVGDAEPLLLALGLAAVDRGLAGRHRQALALAAAAALVRVEVWPFLALYALWVARRDAGTGPALAALAVALPAAWFGPELAASGELLRSTDRARVPNPGAPAAAERPALASLELALTAVLVVPLAAAALAARGRARLLAAAGAAWLALVALMSEAGFSGEARYLLPGAALLAVAGAVAAARVAARPAVPAAAAVPALIVLAAIPRADVLAGLPDRLAHAHALATGLERAIAAHGGRDHVLSCGRPAVGRFRGTLLAYALDVPKHTVRADGAPADVTFSSRLTQHSTLSPPTRRPPTEPWTVTYARGSSCTSDRTGANRSPTSSTRRRTSAVSNVSSDGSPTSRHARTSSQDTGVDTVGRSRARKE